MKRTIAKDAGAAVAVGTAIRKAAEKARKKKEAKNREK